MIETSFFALSSSLARNACEPERATVPRFSIELGLGHADAGVLDHEDAALLVGAQADHELAVARSLGTEQLRLGDGAEPELVERIGGVRDQLAEEDLLVRVQRVDDEGEDPADLGLKAVLGHGARYSARAVRT